MLHTWESRVVSIKRFLYSIKLKVVNNLGKLLKSTIKISYFPQMLLQPTKRKGENFPNDEVSK